MCGLTYVVLHQLLWDGQPGASALHIGAPPYYVDDNGREGFGEVTRYELHERSLKLGYYPKLRIV